MGRRLTGRGWFVGAVAVGVMVAVAAGSFVFIRSRSQGPRHVEPASDDPEARACDLDPVLLERIERGHYPGRSEHITYVPYEPNYLGSFGITSHSGPWDYLQRVPLVLYGPDHVESHGIVEDEATLADVYPTVSEWTDVELPPRAGSALESAINPQDDPAKLLVFVVWDGVGRNVLERWPDAWPNLKRLESDGTSYVNAVVGSSPSITPATHATLGTGTFPNEHGLPAIKYRDDDGNKKTAFAGRAPDDLEVTTFADEVDRRLDNEPKVGMVGLRMWQMPMLGHGAATPGGDKDELVIVTEDGRVVGNPRFYETPGYMRRVDTLDEHIAALDEADGQEDGRWGDNPLREQHDSPAWVGFENDLMFEMLERGDYGADAVPDMFFINYKMTDVVGHRFSMDSEEMQEVLAAQDAALGELVDYLDGEVGDYALVVTADHGSTPPPQVSGGWPIAPSELRDDVNEHFGVPEGETLISTTAVGAYLDPELAEQVGASYEDVASFLNAYMIRDNWPEEELPEGYEGRGDEVVFEAAFPSEDLDEILTCAGLSD